MLHFVPKYKCSRTYSPSDCLFKCWVTKASQFDVFLSLCLDFLTTMFEFVSYKTCRPRNYICQDPPLGGDNQ